MNNLPAVRKPENMAFIGFELGTWERGRLMQELQQLQIPLDKRRTTDRINLNPLLPLWINGACYTDEKKSDIIPHRFKYELGKYCIATEEHVMRAIGTVLKARTQWMRLPWVERLGIFQRAARLLEKKYLFEVVAAVMEDYSKNPFEAFIDVQELVDFWNFNPWYASTIYQEQPDSTVDSLNQLEYLPLEGFVYAVSPNNFIAINGNLSTAPLIMGNVVIAKPSSDVVYSFHLILKILLEAGLPKDVLAVLHGDSKMISDIILDHSTLAGVHFTGGTDTFNSIYRRIAGNIDRYRTYPKLVGETGGKDFIVVYDDHDPVETAAAIVVGGFGCQGRKCSATSRVYMTNGMWSLVKPRLVDFMDKIEVGDVRDSRNYLGAIINRKEYQKIVAYIAQAKVDQKVDEQHSVIEVIGGAFHEDTGWFIHPTVIVVSNPHYKTMTEEIFGPVVTICVFSKGAFDREALRFCNETSPYGLTGAIHTNDVYTFNHALEELRYAAGNIYNWKTTGAVVNQQPFSGGRKSGTNSKVGWRRNLYEWIHPRTISLMHVKPTDFAPPYLVKEAVSR